MKGNNTNRLFLDLKKAAFFVFRIPTARIHEGDLILGRGETR
jgi:hypothetical protein